MGLINELNKSISSDPIQSEIRNAIDFIDKVTIYEARGSGKKCFSPGTLPIIKMALNKQLKIIPDPGGYCPRCGHKILLQRQEYCAYCGQAFRRV